MVSVFLPRRGPPNALSAPGRGLHEQRRVPEHIPTMKRDGELDLLRGRILELVREYTAGAYALQPLEPRGTPIPASGKVSVLKNRRAWWTLSSIGGSRRGRSMISLSASWPRFVACNTL